ncbi:uncharacterized protein LOC126879824 [Diabrotica virgifera virgifera]|uniref:NTF2 fold domain-containing protein n=1 Tax=Diabrotica virgifera virgifera TaxID=50390 RepID=A0ABM5JMC0_DIAVI|nr:uncharacterized protein LOC126879824 [Diabrotica virgifera virgifera]
MKSIFFILLSLMFLEFVVGDDVQYYTDSTTSAPDPAPFWTTAPIPRSTSIGEDVVYVQDRQVPDPTYEIDAVEAFKEAKALHPVVDGTQLLETFSKLFNNKHPIDGGWKVVENLGPLYNPNADYIYIELRVIDANGDRTVRIFNAKN